MPAVAHILTQNMMQKSAYGAAAGAAAKTVGRAVPSLFRRLKIGWGAGRALERGVQGMSHFRPSAGGLSQISSPLTEAAAKGIGKAPNITALASKRIADGDWAVRAGAGLFKHRMPLGAAAALGGANELYTQFGTKPRVMREGAEMGARSAIDMTAGHLANAGFGERLAYLFNPSGAGQRYQEMALAQLAQALGR